jgi:hypothetical protein
MNYDGLDFGPEELISVMLSHYEELLAFISTPPFRALYKELTELVPQDRPGFVTNVLLRRDELERRQVVIPDGILIQTSAFGDRRPTLFVVKKFLPQKYHGAWENVNLTFFNEFNHDELPDPALAWRPPLPVDLQNYLLAQGISLEAVPTEFGINTDSFRLVKDEQTEPGGESDATRTHSNQVT